MAYNSSEQPRRSAGVIINPTELMDYKPMRENKPNTFILFENPDATGKQPNLKGKKFDENGKEWEIAGWFNTSAKGTRYISGKIQEPYKKSDYVPGEDRNDNPFA